MPYPMHMAGVGPDGVYCHLIQMRGLPFKANEADVRKFFESYRVSGTSVFLKTYFFTYSFYIIFTYFLHVFTFLLVLYGIACFYMFFTC